MEDIPRVSIPCFMGNHFNVEPKTHLLAGTPRYQLIFQISKQKCVKTYVGKWLNDKNTAQHGEQSVSCCWKNQNRCRFQKIMRRMDRGHIEPHYFVLRCLILAQWSRPGGHQWASKWPAVNLGTVAQLVVTCSVVFSRLFAQSKGSRDALFLDKPHRGLWFWRGRNHFLAMDWVGPDIGGFSPRKWLF